MPGDFDIYDAFDECGNPPIHLWSRYLKVLVPRNWFCMFEEAKRRQRDWHMRQQQQLIRQSMIQDQSEYYYSHGTEEHQNLQDPTTDSDPSTTTAVAVYSNTDVSSMSLNHENSTSDSIMAPSVVASTNIIDPAMMNDDSSVNLRHQQSMASTTNNNNINNNTPRSRVISHAPSYTSNSGVERSGSIMDREQIRRHLAPGQAKVTSRNNSGSVVTLASTVTTLSPSNKESSSSSPPHHTSLVGGIPEEQKEVITNSESHISVYSTELDFPHDSDRFSIRSDISPTISSPTQSDSLKLSASSKMRQSNNRTLVKNLIWG